MQASWLLNRQGQGENVDGLNMLGCKRSQSVLMETPTTTCSSNARSLSMALQTYASNQCGSDKHFKPPQLVWIDSLKISGKVFRQSVTVRVTDLCLWDSVMFLLSFLAFAVAAQIKAVSSKYRQFCFTKRMKSLSATARGCTSAYGRQWKFFAATNWALSFLIQPRAPLMQVQSCRQRSLHFLIINLTTSICTALLFLLDFQNPNKHQGLLQIWTV